MNAMPLILGVLAALAVAYRYYSAFLAAKVAVLDDTRETPAFAQYDGQNYHPTHKWVLFGHHFAAISGAGPLIGPVLALQFGYLPGLIWIVVGVCLAGAVQDMLVLAASVRRGGRSLAEIARAEINEVAGNTASIAILFVVVIALAGLGVVVVKALGGEEFKLAADTVLRMPHEGALKMVHAGGETNQAALPAAGEVLRESAVSELTIPPGTELQYSKNRSMRRSEAFTLRWPHDAPLEITTTADGATSALKLPAGVSQLVPGSSWGTFTIICTIPIALFVGLWMYKIRKGRVVEASLIGAISTIAVTVAGNWIPGSSWEAMFSLTRGETIWAICIYGFVASVLPVWLLLCPRDYLSSFLKIGTIAILVLGVIIANPTLEAPAVNQVFKNGGGPLFPGAIFPFCFICIMCGAISGFHALVSSGTTPKMVMKESHVRPIGYGAMLIEGLVGIVALLAAAALPQGDYWAVNIDLARVGQYTDALEKLGATEDNLPRLEQQVGGEALRGRTGGAVTLALGMSKVMTEAAARFGNFAEHTIDGLIKYWYHFAIMFEALFILTTIDTGTRIGRFLVQEAIGKVVPKFEKTDWMPGAVISTAIVVAAWGGLIATGSIETIWPMFGIANQMLAVIALAVVTTVMFNAGRGRYAALTIVPMLFVLVTTMTAGYQMITSSNGFYAKLVAAWQASATGEVVKWSLNSLMTVFMVVCVLLIVFQAATRWINQTRRRGRKLQAC
jgi:carbon starvation protein